MRSLFFGLAVVFLAFVEPVEAKSQLIPKWTVELQPRQDALEAYRNFFVGGLNREEGVFYTSGLQKRFEQRSLKTGEVIWSVDLEASSQASWALERGVFYGGDTKGNLYAIESDSGEIIWKKETKGIYFSAPLVLEDRLIVSNSHGHVSAYRLEDGELLWREQTQEEQTLGLWSSRGPIQWKSWVIAGFPTGIIKALNPETGSGEWEESFGFIVEERLGLNDLKAIGSSEDYLVASSYGGNLRVWQMQEGQRRSIWEEAKSLHAAPVIRSEELYFSERDGTLESRELSSGYLRWSYDQFDSGFPAQPALGERSVWVSTSRGQVYLFDRSGELQAKSRAYQRAIWSPPLVVNDNEAIVVTTQGILRRLEKQKLD